VHESSLLPCDKLTDDFFTMVETVSHFYMTNFIQNLIGQLSQRELTPL